VKDQASPGRWKPGLEAVYSITSEWRFEFEDRPAYGRYPYQEA